MATKEELRSERLLAEPEFFEIVQPPAPPEAPPDDNALVAAPQNRDGAMIALVPADPDRYAIDGGEDRDELHVTLAYLGTAADIEAEALEAAREAAERVAGEFGDIVDGDAAGKGMLGSEDPPASVLFLNGASLEQVHAEVCAGLEEYGWDAYHPQHHPWIPHLTIGYGTDLNEIELPDEPIRFDHIRYTAGGDTHDYPLGAKALAAATEVGTVPWTVVEEHAECAAEEPWGVINTDTSELVACHPSREDAEDHVAALYAAEPQEEGAQVKTAHFESGTVDYWANFPRISAKAAERLADMQQRLQAEGEEEERQLAPWSGVLVVEGITTGDGREFAPEALEWGELPVPLRWQKEGAHGGEHDVTVTVGIIEAIWREGEKIMGAGHIDLANPDGAEINRRLENSYPGGISIDADDITDADIEFVWPEDEAIEGEEDDGDLLMMLFAMPEKVIFHAGRIRAATLVDIPAFVEAKIELISDEDYDALVADAHFGPTGNAVTDEDWDGSAARFDDDQYERATAACETGEGTVKDRCFLPHHEPDGRVNRNGVHASASVLGGGRGGVERSAEAVAQAKSHLRAHYEAMDEEPPEAVMLTKAEQAFLSGATPMVLTAAAFKVVDRPPAAWFADPQLSVPTPITVNESGRIYGHAAPWGECHIGQPDVCVTLPNESDHPYFLTGELVTADGSVVPVGSITLGTGHAPIHYRAGPAAEHYDNTGTVVADVTVGNDRHGLWVAGAIRPGTDERRVRELRGAGQLSGDWRRIGGGLRLVGLLAVNVPGFPVPKMRSMVAGGVGDAMVVRALTGLAQGLVARGGPIVDEEEIERRVAEKLAARDSEAEERRARAAELRARVHG